MASKITIKHLLKKPTTITEADYLNLLQRWVLVNSFIYYEEDDSIVSDKEYDIISKQLVALQDKYDGNIEDTQYGYVFYDFDVSTGFHLYHRLNNTDKKKIRQFAAHVMRLYKARR